MRHGDPPPVQALEPVLQHWTIALFEDCGSDGNGVIGRDPNQESIKGGMVQGAEGNAVADNGLTSRLGVRNDVRSFQQLPVSQPAESA